jgi:hypothetical protein
MPMKLFKHIQDAISTLDPNEVREHADRPLRLLLHGDDPDFYELRGFLAPSNLSTGRRTELDSILVRARPGQELEHAHDIAISAGDDRAPSAFAFSPHHPERLIREVLHERPDLAIPLARHIQPFRAPVSSRIIKKISKENALFALATAIPDIVPLLSLPWAIGEFASDTAILTANQIRMAFFLAAANDRDIGYREQRGEVATIMLGAFGWRALARELVGKIPMGGGLLPKAAIAYAATHVEGLSLERYYRIGATFTRRERRVAYGDALERGKTLAGSLMNLVRQRQPAG